MIDVANADLLLSTTRSVRRRLDLDRPVPIDLVEECLSVALQAPTGGNLQSWRFLIVTDADKRQAIGALYRDAWDRYLAAQAPTYEPDDPRHDVHPKVVDSAQYLADHLHEVPIHVVPCVTPRVDGGPLFWTASVLGSVYPAVWSFMLAARCRGLGTTLTTLTLMHEAEVAGLLGIPDTAMQCGLVPVAYFTGDTFRPAPRLPLERVVYRNAWKAAGQGDAG
jgi:nitroreductase